MYLSVSYLKKQFVFINKVCVVTNHKSLNTNDSQVQSTHAVGDQFKKT